MVEKDPTFLRTRDASVVKKRKAAQHFLAFLKAKNGGELTPNTVSLFAAGKMPYGWFTAFCKAHPKALPVHQKQDRGLYFRLLRLYQGAVQDYLRSGAAVVAAAERTGEEENADN